jgi:hypothetical protein
VDNGLKLSYIKKTSNINLKEKMVLEMSKIMNIDSERELLKIFSRLADDNILLNITGAGTPEVMNCCHGGCDNCNYSHVFDNMSAGKPKWVPVYPNRKLIDGRNHMSTWSLLFIDDNSMYRDLPQDDSFYSISKHTFLKKLKELPSKLVLGPSMLVPINEIPNEEYLEVFWSKICSSLNNNSPSYCCDKITPNEVNFQFISTLYLINIK